MRKLRFEANGFARKIMLLAIISPITILISGCNSEKNHINSYDRRDYLPEFYSTNFVLGGGASQGPNMFLRDKWPHSPEAKRAVSDKDTKTYTRTSHSYHTSSSGRPYDNFSYRVVTTSVK